MDDIGARHQPSPSFDELSRQQLEIYARELQQHFREEQRLRTELEERNQQVEQRLQELLALNRLFQGYLEEHHAVINAFGEVVETLNRLARESQTVLDRVRSQRPTEHDPHHDEG